MDSPVLAPLSLSRNARREGPLPALRDRERGARTGLVYGRLPVNVKVERGSTCTFARAEPSIHYLYFIYARNIYVRTNEEITPRWKSTFRCSLRYRQDHIQKV